MEDSDEKMYEKSLNYLSAIGRPIVLKCEQRMSIQHLLLGKDVIAILPTGFGKSIVHSKNSTRYSCIYRPNHNCLF